MGLPAFLSRLRRQHPRPSTLIVTLADEAVELSTDDYDVVRRWSSWEEWTADCSQTVLVGSVDFLVPDSDALRLSRLLERLSPPARGNPTIWMRGVDPDNVAAASARLGEYWETKILDWMDGHPDDVRRMYAKPEGQ
jgi:hypothetical protein